MNPEDLWRDLVGDDANAAYKAMWQLADALDETVSPLADKLKSVTSLQLSVRLTSERMADETECLPRMKKLLVDKDPRVESELTVRRAVAVLAQCDTPAAKELLEELATQKAHEALNDLAGAALSRTRSTPHRVE